MPMSLSVRQKLIAILVLVCLGYAGFGLYAIVNFQRMQEAGMRANAIAASHVDISELEIALLKLEQASQKPSHHSFAGLTAQLGKLSQSDTLARTLKNPYLDDTARENLHHVQEALPGYFNALTKRLTLLKTLGTDEKSGAIGVLNQSAAQADEKLKMFEAFAAGFKDIRAKEKEFLAYPSAGTQADLNAALQELYGKINDIGFGDVFNPLLDEYQAALTPVTESALALADLSQQLTTLREKSDQALSDTTSYLQTPLLSMAQQEAHDTANQARISLIIGGIALTLLIGVVMATVIISLNRSIALILAQLKAVAQGQLVPSKHKGSNDKDEFNQLLATSDAMTLSLRELVMRLQQSNQDLVTTADQLGDDAFSIVSGSEQIRDRSNALATATEEISQTALHVEDMTQQVTQATNDAHQSAQSSANVITDAIQSIQTVAQSIEATHQSVASLGQRSKEIDSVIDLIVGVAEQTTLLALNAAIEAARAGEAGRGFAVVADEVKALAEQTVKATGDITQKVEGIQLETKQVIESMSRSLEQVESGRAKGESAIASINSVEALTQQAAQQTDAIRSAIRDVAQTTQVMARDMDEIAQSIEHNHGATENIQRSGRDIHGHVQSLSQQVSQFQLD
ncbi:methyl-accepting chemotaxis protein [Rhodanobacter aciditrophus]|uniref:Methyl-accepting chemotaxis protein n=1 Tax=Rhodanobacter aciditrophus TaxID=1623218 RepID=A0ABW4B0E3_9GAMM